MLQTRFHNLATLNKFPHAKILFGSNSCFTALIMLRPVSPTIFGRNSFLNFPTKTDKLLVQKMSSAIKPSPLYLHDDVKYYRHKPKFHAYQHPAKNETVSLSTNK